MRSTAVVLVLLFATSCSSSPDAAPVRCQDVVDMSEHQACTDGQGEEHDLTDPATAWDVYDGLYLSWELCVMAQDRGGDCDPADREIEPPALPRP